MTESDLYKSLGELTKSKERWQESVPYVVSLLMAIDSMKVCNQVAVN